MNPRAFSQSITQSPNHQIQLPDYPSTQSHGYPIARSHRDVRSPSAIGRHARLELVFEERRGRTILAHAYAEPPFRVGRALQLGDAAYLILGCTGPGIFAGDSFRQSVRVAAGAHVVLVSQSALQVHPSAAGAAAAIAHDYHVEGDGELCCQWDPVIPFAGARLEQRFDIDVAGAGRLLWGDAIMAGRVRRGEAWRFDSLAHELRVTIDGVLTYLERYALVPAERRALQPWAAGHARYFATAVVHGGRATTEAAEALQGALGDGVRAGVDLVAPGTIAGRIMASEGAPFARARAAFLAHAQATIFGAPGRTARK
jgi:urease accessory protein